MRKSESAQSAMEYLMTYGWAILIIAVVLAVLYQLGVFSGTSFATTGCLSQPGFLCSRPIMNTTGNVSITIGQVSAQTITITELGCSNNQTMPTMVSVSPSIVLASSQTNTTTFQCPIASNNLGRYFSGYLWIGYTTPTQPTAVAAEIATLTVQSTTAGPVGTPIPLPSITTLASVSSGPAGINVSNGYVYFVGLNDGTIQDVPTSGGSNTVLASGQSVPIFVAADGTNVYWTNFGGGTVEKVPITGGSATVLASGQSSPAGIAVSGGYVYWADQGGTIEKESINGPLNSNTVLATGQTNPTGLAVSNGYVYWADQGSGGIERVPITGGSNTVLDPGSGINLAISNGYVYWANNAQDEIQKVSITGGGNTVLVSNQNGPWGITASGSYVYWTDQSGGTVEKGPITGGSNTILATGQGSPYGITVSGGDIYWADASGSNSILKYVP